MAVNYRKIAIAKAKRYGISPSVFLRQIAKESGFNPKARSPAGALGIAQFMPGTAAGYHINPMHPVEALDAAARMDRDNLRKYGSYERMLSAYNSGRPDAYKDPHFASGQTYNYVRDILKGAKPGEYDTPSGGAAGPQGGSGGRSSGSGANFQKTLALTILGQHGKPMEAGALIGLALARQQSQAAGETYGPGGATGGLTGGEPAKMAGGVSWMGASTSGLKAGFMSNLSQAVKSVGGTKIKLTSGYRSPSHNKAVGGVPHSNHLSGGAVDGYVYIPKKGWIPLGTALLRAAPRFGLRSGATFNYAGRPDVVHVDDASNQH